MYIDSYVHIHYSQREHTRSIKQLNSHVIAELIEVTVADKVRQRHILNDTFSKLNINNKCTDIYAICIKIKHAMINILYTYTCIYISGADPGFLKGGQNYKGAPHK